MPGELDLLRWIWKRIGTRRGRIVVDSGDDCAVLRVGREEVLFKIDSVMEGVHFRKSDPLEWVGHKALARPLSDIAAMGGVPTAAIAALAMPSSMTQAQARRVYLGMERLGVPIVGGDITTHRGRLALSVSVLGEMKGLAPVLRRGARAGDRLVATSRRFGGALESGRHLRFTPRLREGRMLARRFRAHAMIDVSDGLVRDVGHICEASGVGVCLFEKALRIRTIESALYDGEDYELLAALSPADAVRAERAGVAFAIGGFEQERGVRLERRDRSVLTVQVRGWEHSLRA